MGRNRESRTGIAVLAFIVASTAAQFNSPADLRDDCTDKSDGIYPTGHCSTYFLECSGGKTTKQNCSTGLWFNSQSSQCDYRENIVACQEAFSCIGRDDGVYGEGCSSMFWFCSGGQLKHSLCPDGTFFNPHSHQCDFRSKIKACGGDSTASSAENTRSNRLTTVPPTTQSPSTEGKMRDKTEVPYGQTYPTYAPRQRISGRVSKTPLDESSAGTACAGKEDGSHSMNKCSGQYVLCWAGTGQVMNCQKGLIFNEVSHQCDYPHNVDGCNGSPSVSLDKSYGGVVSAAPSTASLPIPRQPIQNNCSSLPDGVYGSSCSRHFFHCVNGVSYEKSCSEGLVYNEANKQCDYKEKCESSSSSSASSDALTTAIPVVVTVENTIDFDCSSRSDGLYSRGCISEFYQCSSGRVTVQTCPDGLVFDDFTKACDYPQICSSPHSSVSLDSMSSVYSRPSTTSIPTAAALSFDCSSRVDGLYSEGCVSHFFQCSSGLVSSYLCNDGLVFDGVSQRCEYPDKCGQPRPLEEDTPLYNLPLSTPSSDYNKKNLQMAAPISFDCTSLTDGSYGNSCAGSFVQCVSGLAYTLECPQGLVFDEKSGSCDYPERCGKIYDAVEVPVVESSSVRPVQETLTPIDIDCFNRADGLYSSGCSRTYVQCANGMKFNQLCPEGLVFIKDSGMCDYASSCKSVSSPPSTVAYAPSPPSSAPYKPSVVNETPSPPKRDEPSGVLIDCSTLADGRYTSGCSHAFVQCANGAAVPLECPAGLVFDKRVDQCVWPESCSSMDSPSLPTVPLPIGPSDVPSTVYDMKEEKDGMVTDAPVPEVSKDGSVCTGTGRRAMGKCSSGFVQCIGGKMVARRCPGQSLFDEKIGLCVYDMDGCEMDVDIVDANEEESTVAAAETPLEDVSSTGYDRQPLQSAPSYTQQTASQSVYQQQYSQNSPQDQTQNGYQSQTAPIQYQNVYQAQAEPSQYQNEYQTRSAPAEYQNGYGSVPAYPSSDYQSPPQYQHGYGFESVPVYSSFDDSSLSSQSQSSAECDIGSFRRVSACSPSFDACSPTARQWIRRICGKSHRFDSTVNRCRPIFEIRECDEPMSSYIPPPVQMEIPAVFPNVVTSFENGVPLSGREYEDNKVRDPFKGGYRSGMMGSNPFVAIGRTGSFYTDDGMRWVGSAWSEGGERRRGGKRHYKQGRHRQSGDYVIVSGNPFGAGRDRVLNDEWEGRRSYDGPVRSSLTHARGHRVRNVEDNFKGRVSHFAPPLRDVNPFAVKRGDGYRRKGRKSCRRDKHRRRDDWEDDDCEEKKELERPTARSVIDEHEEERGMEMEDEESPMEEQNEVTESMEESTIEEESSEYSEAKEFEINEDENEKTESDPELLPESIDNEETKENEVNGEEKDEENEEKNEEDDEIKDEKEEIEDANEEKEENEDGEEVNEVEKTEENEENEESTEENEDGEEVNEVDKTEEKIETTTMKGPFEEVDDKIEERKNEEDEDDEDGEEESGNESTEEESSDGKNIEERAESEENEEKENEGDVSEEEIEKEIVEEGEATEETKNEDVESPESVEKEESAENEKDEETDDGNTNENEEIDAENGGEREEIEEEEEMTEETKNEDVESPESIEKEEKTDGNEEIDAENGGEREEIEEEEEMTEETKNEDVESPESVEKEEKTDGNEEIDAENGGDTLEIEEDGQNENEQIDEEKEEVKDNGTTEGIDNEESEEKAEEEVKENNENEVDDPEQPESIENEVKEEDEVEKNEENEEMTTKKRPFEEIDDKIEERKNEEEEDDDEKSAETDENIGETEVEKVEDEEVKEVNENEDEVKEEGEVDGDESNTEEDEENLEESAREGNGEVEMHFNANDKSEEKSDEEMTEGNNGEVSDEEESANQKEEDVEAFDLVDKTENRRRRRSIVYDGSSSQSSSSPRRLSIPRSSRLHRSRFSRLCVSSSAGQTISIGQCRQDFVYCKSTRRPVVAACPVGDLFDALQSTCVPTEICGAERVKMDIPPTTSASSSSSYIGEGEKPTMPIPAASIVHDNEKIVEDTSDCSTLSDGAYPISGCSSHYFVCSASVKHVYTCPSGLVYHKGSDGCEWPTNVVECTGGAASDSTSSPVSPPRENDYSGDSVSRDLLATTTPSTVSPMHVHFDCMKDGGFAIDCKGGFVMCSNGISSFMKCPPSLVFEESTQSCQYPAHVVSCGLTPSSVLDVSSTASPVYTPSTTSSSPAMAIETLVTTPVHKDACTGGSNSLEGATKVCATSFVICKEGEVTAVMNCADGTFFNEKTKECDYREVACAGGWSGEAQGVESPVEEDVPTVSTVIEGEEYGRRASRPYRPLMPVAVEKIEKNEEVKRDEVIVERPMVIPSNIEPAKDATCDWKGAAPSGLCSSQFITCSNGRPEVMVCSSGLVFSSSTSACEYPTFVAGCPQWTESTPTSSPYTPSLPSTPSPVSDALFDDESSSPSSTESSEYSRPSLPSTTTMNPLLTPIETGEHTTDKFEATGDHCTFFADRPAFPLNYCSMTFAVCTAQGMAYRTNCSFGFLFDSVLRQCVPSEHCGQPYMKDIAAASPTSSSPHHTLGGWDKDSRCVGMKDGTLKAIDICSGQYIKCYKEGVIVQSCSGTGRVFSALTGRCVMQVQMAECSSPKGSTPAITRPKTVSPSTPSSDVLSSPSESYSTPPSPSHRGARIRGGLAVSSSSTQFDASTFCTTKHTDGLYRNPENCAGIVQCFGGEAFSYPSCAPGLFFNEVDSQCDYASNVPECASQTDPIALDDSSASCKGQPHGAHLADDSDCSIYYRCVWGSLERLTCPDGTVFNPRLSVCDYPSQVPHCLTQ